jgi:hypothetical protein
VSINFKDETNLLKNIHGFVNSKRYSHRKTKFLLVFISEDSKKKLKKVFYSKSKAKLLKDIKTDELVGLWKSIIIDAINFLRINDARERSFLNKNKKSTVKDAAKARELNAYGVEELHSYFKEFTNFESILYGSDEYYRDHVQHPLFVWLMGLHVLIKCVEHCSFRVSDVVDVEVAESANINYCDKHCVEELGEQVVSSAEVGAMWAIVALTHDLGYPLQKVDLINSQLQKMLEKFGRVDFRPAEFSIGHQHSYLVKHLLTLLSSSIEFNEKLKEERKFSTHIRPKYFTKYSKSWEAFNHGMISSLILLRSLTYFLETDATVEGAKGLKFEDARQFSIRAEMLHAIASHTTPKVYHILANNLAFILMLCDDLHEWNRPTMSDIVSDTQSGASKVKLDELSINKGTSKIQCSFIFPACDYDLQQKKSFRAFKTWHERLRPAVDDAKRNMEFTWIIEFEKTKTPWIFYFNSSNQVFHEVKVTGPQKKNNDKQRTYNIYKI